MHSWQEALACAIAGKQDRDIVIIGKGPSIDNIDTRLLNDFIILNVNDSEVIYPGEIAAFHHGWVLDVLERHGPRCRLYVTDRPVHGATQSLHANYVPYTPDTAELLINRFFSDVLHIEHAILVSALKIANELAHITGGRKRVFLLGFDFSTQEGWSRHITSSPSESGVLEIAEQAIGAQEDYLQHILHEKERLNIDITHIGNKPYSIYSPEAFNDLLYNRSGQFIAQTAKTTAAPYQVKIVAEITTNHFGDMDRLRSMILAAKRAGADFIKLQKRDVESFYSREDLDKPYASPFGTTLRDYRVGLELSREQFEWVDEFCKAIDIGWFASVLDYPSYRFMLQFSPALIKLPSTISEHQSFLQAVGKEFTGDLVISTGFTDSSYEHFILETFQRPEKIYLLQCTSAYPSRKEDTQIGIVRHYYNLGKQHTRIIPGFSSHDIGSLCSQMAVAAGALMIEKHVKYGSVAWSHFDEVAVDLVNGDFEKFVQDIRLAERVVGSEQKTVKSTEHHKYHRHSN